MPDRPQDAEFMRAALDAAEEGLGRVSPNPLVGTVIVRDGEIVGRGAHFYDQRKHAEVVALEEAGARARGATAYVNLEPCSHYGRTPPCADALVEAGVARVVASMRDPASYVNGRGFERLRAAGVEVEVGVGQERAERLNERYLRYITSGRPFVLLKLATTLDGRVATGSGASKWITGTTTRAESQELRRAYDAILVGVNTALADDPELTYRGAGAKRLPLVRAVVDPRLRLSPASRLLSSAPDDPLVIYTRELEGDAARAGADALRARGADVVALPEAAGGRLDLVRLLEDLGSRKINGLIVEGGPETAAAFVERRLVDKVTFFVAPKILGGRDSLGAVGGGPRLSLEEALELGDVSVRRLGDDLEITGYPRIPAPEAAPGPGQKVSPPDSVP